MDAAYDVSVLWTTGGGSFVGCGARMAVWAACVAEGVGEGEEREEGEER